MTRGTLTYICMTVNTELTTNTVIIFLFRGILLCPRGLRSAHEAKVHEADT